MPPTTPRPVREPNPSRPQPWWRGVASYEWMVLAVASAEWVFDAFEGLIFNLTRSQLLTDILGAGASRAEIAHWGDVFLGIFLAGGTFGGILFGWLGDRWGRKPTMAVIVQAIGAALGLLTLGPVCVRLGRRRTFILFQVGALVVVPAACFLPRDYPSLLALLPLVGFFCVGIHAGFAIYFPELFPNHLRATGAGFCFNTGRLLAAPILFSPAGSKPNRA